MLVHELETFFARVPYNSLSNLPANHEIRVIIRRILYIAPESIERTRTPLAMSQKIVQLLYKTPSQLGREIYVAVLEQLCQSFEDVAREAITWLIYAEDEVRVPRCYSGTSSHSEPIFSANSMSQSQLHYFGAA